MKNQFRKLLQLLRIVFAVVLASSAATQSAVADHHLCTGGGINVCISALIGTTNPDQAPGNVLNLAFGSIQAGSSTTKTLTMGATNNPGFTTQISSISITGTNAADFSVTGGTCSVGLSLAKKATCTINIKFSPTAVGAKSANILVGTQDMTRTTSLSATATLPPPVITSALAAAGTKDAAFSGYQITANYSPTSFSASSLPPGLSINGTGYISGTPSSTGTYNASITATNATGSDTETLVFTIANNVPIITSSGAAAGTTGAAFNYQIVATNTPTSYGATSLPTGLSVNTGTGAVSGTPQAGGVYNINVTATNAIGTASKAVAITVASVVPSGSDTTLSVPLNTPTNLDLSTSITGPFISSVAIATKPAHGSITSVVGTVVTYTPVTDYFGDDSFTYTATNSDGTSAAKTVAVTVTGRPDPTQSLEVEALVTSFSGTGENFAQSQIQNYSQRFGTLHSNHKFSSNSGNFSSQKATQINKAISQNQYTVAARSGNDFQMNLTPATVDDSENEPFYGWLASNLQSMVQSGTMNLSYSSDDGSERPQWLPSGTNIWLAGNVNLGTRDKTTNSEKMSFTTNGISFGIDHAVQDNLTVGAGLGYARGKSDIGSNGSDSVSKGKSISFYGSYMPTEEWFVDGLLGYGTMDYESSRYVSSINAFAESKRDGKQLFGSLAFGYEFRKPGFLFSPYGRLDFSHNKLDATTETGVGTNALTYHDQSQTQHQISLGLRAESAHRTRFGWANPYVLLEVNRDYNGDQRADVSYTDLAGVGTRYSFRSDEIDRTSLTVGLGADFVTRSGLRMGLDYQTSHSLGPEQNQSINFWVRKSLDEKVDLKSLPHNKFLNMPIYIQTGMTFDSNINRVVDTSEQIYDTVYDLNIGTGTSFKVTDYSRVKLNLTLGGQRFYRFHELEKNTVNARAAYEYRTSRQFDAYTLAIESALALNNFTSGQRDNSSSTLGLSVSQSLTDRINWSVGASTKITDAKEKVFDNHEKIVRLQLDYSLGRKGSLYFNREFRRGYSVSSTSKAYTNTIGLYTMVDDAFSQHSNKTYTATRFNSDTRLTTWGYNFPLGPDDSIDFSYRKIKATPDEPSVPSSSYRTEQFSIFYITRF